MAGNYAKKGKDSSNVQHHWTNERHVHFLNTMEASFVRSMFGHNNNNNINNISSCNNSPPLDRYLPDTSDSTEDLAKERRRRRHSTSDIAEPRGRSSDRKPRNSLSHISCQDQVVPQVQKRGDDKDKDQKDHLRTSLGTAH